MVCDDLGTLLSGMRNEKTGVFCIFSSFPTNTSGELKSQPLFFPELRKTQPIFPPDRSMVHQAFGSNSLIMTTGLFFKPRCISPSSQSGYGPRIRKATAVGGTGLGEFRHWMEENPPTCGVNKRNSTPLPDPPTTTTKKEVGVGE